jgi:hypothetical protein
MEGMAEAASRDLVEPGSQTAAQDAQQDAEAVTGGPDALMAFPASSVATTIQVMLPSAS